MSITKCPFNVEELKELLSNDGPGWEPSEELEIVIDNTKKEVRWKKSGSSWTSRISFEVLNVWKVVGKNPVQVFMEEYKKKHPVVSGTFLPNVPSMLETWAKEFNESHQNRKK